MPPLPQGNLQIFRLHPADTQPYIPEISLSLKISFSCAIRYVRNHFLICAE